MRGLREGGAAGLSLHRAGHLRSRYYQERWFQRVVTPAGFAGVSTRRTTWGYPGRLDTKGSRDGQLGETAHQTGLREVLSGRGAVGGYVAPTGSSPCLVTVTLSPAVPQGSRPSTPKTLDATKTRGPEFGKTLLCRSLVQIGGPQPLAGEQVPQVQVRDPNLNPRARGGRRLGAEPRPRPTGARRRRVLIRSARGRGGRRRAGAARWHSY